MSSHPRTFYFAGELFSAKHLLGNAALALEIERLSEGRFLPVLPQSLPQAGEHPHDIRDMDLYACLDCDMGLFHYDGTDLDSGTVVEFLFNKVADIPSVLLRTDFRKGGDQEGPGDPWNLMTSFFPRTEVVVLDAMAVYQKELASLRPKPWADACTPALSLKAAELMTQNIAQTVVAALDRVAAQPPLLDGKSAEDIYRWLAKFPNFRDAPHAVERLMKRLEARRAKETELGS